MRCLTPVNQERHLAINRTDLWVCQFPTQGNPIGALSFTGKSLAQLYTWRQFYFAQLFDSIRLRRPGLQGRSVEIINAIYESGRTGREVKVGG